MVGNGELPAGRKIFFQKNPILLRILGLGIENPLVFLKFSLGIQGYSVLSLFLRTSLLLSLLLPHYSKFLNKTKNTHKKTLMALQQFFLGGSKVLGVVLPPEDFFAAVFSFVPLLEVS